MEQPFQNLRLELKVSEEDVKKIKEKNENTQKGCIGVRHIQGILLFSSFFTAFFLRLNLSVGIVAMTNQNSSNPNFTEFEWTEREKGTILSSFFWGYLLTQAIAGELGQKFSPKLLLLISNTIVSTLAALIPVSAFYGGPPLISAIRVVQGLCQGFLVPLSYNLVSKWAPPNERNRFVGFSMNGGTLGAMIVFPVCGLLASSAGGWPSIFYVSSALGLTWSITYFIFGSDSPSKHKTISVEERNYIENELVHTSFGQVYVTPWKKILTTTPVYALIAAFIGNGWGFSIITTEMPSYINSVLDFDISSNGFISAIPYLSMWLLTFPVCWVADEIQKKKLLSDSFARKMWTTISQTGGALLLLTMGFVGRDAVAAIILLTLSVSLSACMFSGFNINHLDLAPNFAGVLMGITNGLENVSTILAPLTVGWIVTDIKSVEQWRIIFILTATAAITGNLIFNIFGSTEVQSWNKPEEKIKAEDNNQSNVIVA